MYRVHCTFVGSNLRHYHFKYDQTYVAILAWLPEKIIYGKPRILDVCVVSGLSVALARDTH